MAVDLSVVVCTYLRAHRLIDCLKSLEKQTLNPDRFEVVVVSKDLSGENAELFREFLRNSKLDIKHVNEGKRGLSVARNAGIRKAAGRIIHFLDDDTVAESTCLEAYMKIFNVENPLCAGGRILPKFLIAAPPWFKRSHWSFIGALDLGDKTDAFNFPSSFPVGANVAFKREVFEKLGFFDEDLGIHGRKKVGGEETDLCYRIQSAGGKIIYCPDAIVQHCIEGDKLTRKWLIRTAYRQGKGAAILQLKQFSMTKVLSHNLKSLLSRFMGASPRISTLPRSALCLETSIPLSAGYAVEMFKALFS